MSHQDDEIATLRGELEELQIALAAAQADRDQASEAAGAALLRLDVEEGRRRRLERQLDTIRNALVR